MRAGCPKVAQGWFWEPRSSDGGFNLLHEIPAEPGKVAVQWAGERTPQGEIRMASGEVFPGKGSNQDEKSESGNSKEIHSNDDQPVIRDARFGGGSGIGVGRFQHAPPAANRQPARVGVQPVADGNRAELAEELARLGSGKGLDSVAIIPTENANPHQSEENTSAAKSLPINEKPQSPHVWIEPDSTRVGKAGRQPKIRNDQPPHIPHCEWRASNKRTDGELSWRLLAVIEWLDPVSGEKQKKTQHVGYLSAVVWKYMRGFDYEKRKQICEQSIGDKARVCRQSLEAYREEAVRLSIAGNGGNRG